jgi:hypothetical protein
MSSWAPAGGWTIQLGASWASSWWGPRGGDDFFLETQARETRPAFQGVLRGGWVAKARGEAPVDAAWGPRNPGAYGKGGVWAALMAAAVVMTAPLVGAFLLAQRRFIEGIATTGLKG